MRPILSDRLDQKKRPAILNRLSKAVKPAAALATAARSDRSSSANFFATPISDPPKTSCNMGDAMPIMPIPALTFMHSTIHTSQNWGIPQTRLTCTWRRVTIVCAPFAGCGAQAAGLHPAGGIR